MSLSLLVNIGASSTAPILGQLVLVNRHCEQNRDDGASSNGLEDDGLSVQNRLLSREICITLARPNDVYRFNEANNFFECDSILFVVCDT